jgi:hypothetical protein
MPLEPLVLPAPDAPLPRLPEPVEPVLPAAPLPVVEELVPPADDEPEAEPCSRRQRSFSEPVRLSHWMLLPTLGEVDELVLGEEVEPLDEPVAAGLWLPPTLCPDEPDEVCAIEAAENANRAARAEVQRILNIGASPM